MMPLDLLTDDRHLYSIMPYCNGGELFERLDMDERFTEEEARYWMAQVLNVSGVHQKGTTLLVCVRVFVDVCVFDDSLLFSFSYLSVTSGDRKFTRRRDLSS